MDVDILKKFIPYEYTLKCKSSIDELIISSHCMKMMSMAVCSECVRYYLIYINFGLVLEHYHETVCTLISQSYV